jgi:hypothetical protein
MQGRDSESSEHEELTQRRDGARRKGARREPHRIPFQQRANHAAMPHVGNAGDDAPVRCKPPAYLFEYPRGLAQVLEDIGAVNRVERSGRDLEIKILDVSSPHMVKPPARARRRPGPSNSMREAVACCRCLIASPSRPAPQPISSTRRAACGTNATSSGRGYPE